MAPSDNPQYMVLDLETTVNSLRKNKADPFDTTLKGPPYYFNDIVLAGWKFNGGIASNGEAMRGSSVFTDNATVFIDKLSPTAILDPKHTIPITMIVGHNLTFDCHYLLRDSEHFRKWFPKIRVWDTQLAEYLLSGQTKVMPSLDDCSRERGGSVKDNRLAVMWEAGMKTEDIPLDMLTEYLENDVQNTDIVFVSQFKEAMEKGMMPLIRSQMEALQATIDATFNGMKIDRVRLDKESKLLALDTVDLFAKIQLTVDTHFDLSKLFNVDSNKDLANLLFGGITKEKVKMLDGQYLNGNPKYKTVEEETRVHGMCCTVKKHTPTGLPVVDEEVLQNILTDGPNDGGVLPASLGGLLIQDILDYKEKKKQLSTYYKGIETALYPDDFIHHRLNHTVTRTGRLSSSEPNLQNVTNGPIKAVFTSRFGADGMIMEADFAQLEMVALAALCRDAKLVSELLQGRDLHTYLYQDMYGRPPTKEERKAFKPAAFCLVYGGGAAAIAAQTGMSKKDGQRFIDTFYARYPGVKTWHETLIATVGAGGTYAAGLKDTDGVPLRECMHISHTGRRYVWREYDAPDWIKAKKNDKLAKAYSPTEIKNYPVQGLATGDIVPMVLGKLWRAIRSREHLDGKCYLVNTVHDSIMFDVHMDVCGEVALLVKTTMEDANNIFKGTFGVEFGLKLGCSVSVGPNWLEQGELDSDVFYVQHLLESEAA